MNTGAFGEGFPYTNFHDLNMDWIIKIAKDFLDQYTSIQQIIADGETSLENLTEESLQQLQDKADNLESLLQAWYNEHSEDIAQQLASALSDIASTLSSAITSFNNAADAKAQTTIASIPDDYTTLSNEAIKNITDSIYSTSLPISDADDAGDNTIYWLVANKNTIAHLPDAMGTTEKEYFMLTTSNELFGAVTKKQIIFDTMFNAKYTRIKSQGQWSAWTNHPSYEEDANILLGNIRQVIYSNNLPITDANNAESNRIYWLVGDNTTISHLPSDFTHVIETWLITFENALGNAVTKHQFIFAENFTPMYKRTYATGSWSDWENLYIPQIIYMGANEKYKNIREALAYSNTHPHTTIIIRSGTYNILSLFENNTPTGLGFNVGNDVHIIAEPEVVFNCLYEGSDTSVRNNFSIFNMSPSDATIEGIFFNAKNIRYCVHDDTNANANPYTHTYKNCTMHIDNRNSGTPYKACLGIGMGNRTRIIIDGGYYFSEDPDAGQNATILVHNAGNSTAVGSVWIKDVYFEGLNSNCRFGYYGTSTANTHCYVTNCCMDKAPVVIPETPQSSVVNMVLVDWNNVIRHP